MEALNATGTFWFPDGESLAVYGSIVFDPIDGTILTPLKRMAEPIPDGGTRETWGGMLDRIFGRIQQGSHEVAVTLIDCIWLSSTTFRVNRLLVGGHFPIDDTTFHQAIIRLSDLPAWVAQDAINVDIDEALEGIERRELRVDLDRPPASTAPFHRGQLSLDFRWSRDGIEYEQLTIGQWPQFEITYTEPASLTAIMDDAASLQSLLTLCTDNPGFVASIALYRPDYPERLFNGTAIPDTMRRIELLAPFRRPPGRKRVEQYQMLVSFTDVGGIVTVASWLDEAIRLRVIIGSLVTMRADGIFGENRFLNVCSAAEGFHRSTVGGSLMDKAEFKSLKRQAKKSLPKSHHRWFDDRLEHANDPQASGSALSNSPASSTPTRTESAVMLRHGLG